MSEEIKLAKDNFEKVPTQEVVEEPEEKKKKSTLRKVIDWVVTGLFGILIVCSVGFTIYTKVSESKGENSYLFGYMFPVVLTDSMCPDYPVDSVLVIKKTDPSTIKEGDDVMFYYDFEDGNGQVKVTHRILTANKTENDGNITYTFTAHGINTESEFCGHYENNEWIYSDCTGQIQTFNQNDVIGVVVGKASLLSFFYKIVSSTWGLIIIILIPAMYLIVSSVIDIFKKLPDDDEPAAVSSSGGTVAVKTVTRPDGSDPLAGMTPEEKERLKKQLLEQMLGKGGKK